MSLIFPNPPGGGVTIQSVGDALAQYFCIVGGTDALGSNGTLGTGVNTASSVFIGQFATTSYLRTLKRTTYGVAVANQIVGISTINGNPNRNNFWRDPTNSRGTFYCRMFLGIEEVGVGPTPERWFMCLGSAPANINTIVDPSTSIDDCFGMIKDGADTNWQFCARTGAGIASKQNLLLAPAVGQVFSVEFLGNSAGTSIRCRILLLTDPDSSTVVFDETRSTNLPTIGQSFGVFGGGRATGTGNTTIAVMSVYGLNNKVDLPAGIT